MTEEKETPDKGTQPESTSETATPEREPEGTLASEAANAVDNDSPKAALAKELSPEQLKQVDRLVSQAIDGAKRTWSEKQEKELAEKGYLTPDQAKAIAQEQVRVAEERAKAEANVSLWLRESGVDPSSEQAKQVFAEYRDGLEAGRYTNKMLLDKKGVKYLVGAAGIELPSDERELQLPRKPMPVNTSKGDDGKPLSRQEKDARIREANLKAIKEYAASRR